MSTILTITNLIATIKSYTLYSSIVIVIIGIVGNILNILIFNNLKIFRGNVCSFYLNFESIINMAAIIFVFISNALTVLGDNPANYSIIWCKIQSMVFQIFTPLALSTVCLMAFDQFLSTCPIFYIRQFSTIKSARYYLLMAACFWIIHSIPFGIFSDNSSRIACFPSNRIFLRYYLYFYYPVMLGIAPMLISSISSLFAFRNVRRIVRRQTPIIRRKLDQQMTVLVFARVIVLVILYIPYIIFYIYSFSSHSTTSIVQFFINQFIGIIIASLAFLNNAVISLFRIFSFLIYRFLFR